MRIAFLRPVANRVASKIPTAPPLNRARKAAASSTVTCPCPRPAPFDAAAEQPPAGRLGQRALVDEGLEQPADA